VRQLAFVMCMVPCLVGQAFSLASDDDRTWKFDDKETIRRSFDVSASAEPKRLLVDNVSGFVHVTGYAGKEVQVTVEKSTKAWSKSALDEARRDVKLDMSQQGNFVRLYVDGPFRSGNGVNYRWDDYYGYRVNMDYEIQVPPGVELVLKTVNHGDILVKKTTGDFEIHGINGGIEMEEVAGSGSVRTINGPVKVTFAKNPTGECRFYTLNGKLDVYFQPSLNANLGFKTFNGSVYTDFDLTALPVQPAAGEQRNGKFVFRSNRSMSARAGKGGPDLSFEAFNGTIRLFSRVM
jgi:hypothetical protein